ncbi:hypothetical protein [Haliangium ochraceum]|uniref:hypothetical protein n=1 Tax=Haliangium ochraceum TaxID=80816 RepID=UPI001E3D7884|nr:hypothetical protein [Haliangium ochraceum]
MNHAEPPLDDFHGAVGRYEEVEHHAQTRTLGLVGGIVLVKGLVALSSPDDLACAGFSEEGADDLVAAVAESNEDAAGVGVLLGHLFGLIPCLIHIRVPLNAW